MFGSWSWIISVFVALSTFGGVNGMILVASRLFWAGAQEQQLPRFFSFIHYKRETPIPTILFSVSSRRPLKMNSKYIHNHYIFVLIYFKFYFG
jgi:amino acid permease